ncbi:MAG: SusD/RagB family nutrient-binding outer membrane lipoprotein [Sphingobacteriaceae bacterium]|nr:SusD/RagB family nutrient-binding outer membrane lipoprotein [Sphingobacteriaceae bacterium]
MKKYLNISLLTLLLVAGLSSCKKPFDELHMNPNKPVAVQPHLLLLGILNNLNERPTNYDKVNQYYLVNYDYYGNNKYELGQGDNYFTTLSNSQQMVTECDKLGLPKVNAYSTVDKFLRAFLFHKMTMQMGDFPMSETLKGLEILKPKYDTQKEVFKAILALLDEANTDFAALAADATAEKLQNDIYYGGDLRKWQKLTNTLRLRVLMDMSKKEADADLNIKTDFNNVVTNPTKYPLMESIADNLVYKYINPTNKYPNNPDNYGKDAIRYNTSATYIDLVKKNKDPRLFITAEPSRYLVDTLVNTQVDALIKAGTLAKKDSLSKTKELIAPLLIDYNSYEGAPAGLDQGLMLDNANKYKYSLINRKRYYSTYTGEDGILVGYAEQNFLIAEAANRGWIALNAETYYKQGIKASWDFYGIPTKGDFNAYSLIMGEKVTESSSYIASKVSTDFDVYYAQPEVSYKGNDNNGLAQILEQKYIAGFRNSGQQAYFDNRRTGLPAFHAGAGTGNGSRLAKRYQYFSVERSANSANLAKALEAYNNIDDINGLMWILK